MANLMVVEFKTEYKGDRATDWVLLAPSGEGFDRTKTWHRVKDITPPTEIDDDSRDTPTMVDIVERWKLIEPRYRAFKAGDELPEDGMPLAAWSGVSPEQAAVLRRIGIKSVEDVAAMGGATVDKLPFPNARKLPALAADYLAGKGKADAAQELADMKEKMLVMEEMLSEAMEKKRGPGRPRKEEAEAA